MSALLDNPSVVSAIISGIVSMVIAISGGAYTLILTNRKIKNLRQEITIRKFSEYAAENFLHAHEEYKKKFRKHEIDLCNTINHTDGTVRIQLIIDFYADQGRWMVEQFPDFLGDRIVSAGARMQRAVNALSKHFEPNNPSKLHYAAEVQEAGVELHAMISKVCPR